MAGETRLQTAIRRVLAAAGAYVRKNHGGPHGMGRPDLEGCLTGLHFGFEVKVPGKDATPIQAQELGEIRQAGGWAGVVTSVDQVKDIIRMWPFVCRYCLGPVSQRGDNALWCVPCEKEHRW